MSLEGTIQDRELAGVLVALGWEKRTGILTVQGEQEIIGVSFLRGEVVSADALNQTLEEGLGEVLAARRLVQPEDLAALAAEHQSGGGRVMDLLIERNYLTREELLDALRHHTYRLCRQVLSWRSGEYKFYRGEEVSYEEGVGPIGFDELLVQATRDLGDVGPLPGRIPEPEAIYDRTTAEADYAAAGYVDDLPEEYLEELEGAAERLLSRVDGERTVGEVLTGSGLPKARSLLAFHWLHQTGRVSSGMRMGASLPAAEVEEAPEPPEPVAEVVAAPSRPSLWSRLGDRVAGDVASAAWLPWAGRLAALALAVTIAWLAASRPDRFLLPLPWQSPLRQSLVEQQRSAAYAKIDRAAKTFFLLEGRFPESLAVLVDEGLIHQEDLVGPDAVPLGYSARAANYLIGPQVPGDPPPGTTRVETIKGDFLLDPEFVAPELTDVAPLILLD